MLQAAGLDPTIVVGGRVIGAGEESERTGARLGTAPFLVAEADESDGSFLHLSPVIAVVTNIEAEHLDHHGSLEALEDAFVAFLDRACRSAARPCSASTTRACSACSPRVGRRRISYGLLAQADWVASEVAHRRPRHDASPCAGRAPRSGA